MSIHHDTQRKFVNRVRMAKTGWGRTSSQCSSVMATVLEGDAFLALETGRQGAHKPGPKKNRQRHAITLPTIGGKP